MGMVSWMSRRRTLKKIAIAIAFISTIASACGKDVKQFTETVPRGDQVVAQELMTNPHKKSAHKAVMFALSVIKEYEIKFNEYLKEVMMKRDRGFHNITAFEDFLKYLDKLDLYGESSLVLTHIRTLDKEGLKKLAKEVDDNWSNLFAELDQKTSWVIATGGKHIVKIQVAGMSVDEIKTMFGKIVTSLRHLKENGGHETQRSAEEVLSFLENRLGGRGSLVDVFGKK